MTQSEIYDRILRDIILNWSANCLPIDESVAKIREISKAYWWSEGDNYESYISIHYPQYYKELEK